MKKKLISKQVQTSYDPSLGYSQFYIYCGHETWTSMKKPISMIQHQIIKRRKKSWKGTNKLKKKIFVKMSTESLFHRFRYLAKHESKIPLEKLSNRHWHNQQVICSKRFSAQRGWANISNPILAACKHFVSEKLLTIVSESKINQSRYKRLGIKYWAYMEESLDAF